MLQTHCVKYQINISWCQLDKCSYQQSESIFIKRNCVFDIIDINVLAYCHWTIELWTSSALCFNIRYFLSLLKPLSLAANSRFGVLANTSPRTIDIYIYIYIYIIYIYIYIYIYYIYIYMYVCIYIE